MGLPAKRIPIAKIRVKGKQRKGIDLSKCGLADAIVNVDVYPDKGNLVVEIELAAERNFGDEESASASEGLEG